MNFSASCIVRSPRRRVWLRYRDPMRTVEEVSLASDAKQRLTSRPPTQGRFSERSFLIYVIPLPEGRIVMAFAQLPMMARSSDPVGIDCRFGDFSACRPLSCVGRTLASSPSPYGNTCHQCSWAMSLRFSAVHLACICIRSLAGGVEPLWPTLRRRSSWQPGCSRGACEAVSAGPP